MKFLIAGVETSEDFSLLLFMFGRHRQSCLLRRLTMNPRNVPMRRLLLSSCVALTLAGSGGFLAPALISADIPVPAPMVMPDDTAYAVVVIPDLLATLGRIEAIADLFAPGKMPKGSLKAQLGNMLGDPELANFTGKPVVIVVGPGAPTPSFALLVPAKDPQMYLDAAVNFDLLLGKAVDGIAVMTKTPDGEILGEKIAKAYPNLVKAGPKGDIRFLIAPDKLSQAYGGMLGMFAQMAAGQGGNPEAAQLMGLELAGMMAMAADVTSVQLDLRLDAAGIIGEEFTIAAKPGSAFATALAAPAAVVGPRAASRLGAEPSLMSMSGRVNWNAMSTYTGKILDDLKAKPEGKELISDELIATVKAWGATLTGDSAFRLRSVDSETMPFQWDGLYGCADSVKAEANVDSVFKLLAPGTTMGKMYERMGMTMSLAKAKRKSPSGVPVHKVSMTLDETKLPPAQAQQMKMWTQGYELAMPKGWFVMAQDPAQLDSIIAGTGKGMSTAAEKAIGAGRHIYGDVDLIGFVRATMKMSGMDAMVQIPDTVKSGDPISMASTVANGRAFIEVQWPLAPLAELAKAMNGGGGRRGRGNVQQPPPDQDPAF